jgi:hypothetical protein
MFAANATDEPPELHLNVSRLSARLQPHTAFYDLETGQPYPQIA